MGRVTLLILFIFTVALSGTENGVAKVESLGGQTAILVSEVVKQHLDGCHLVLATTGQQSQITQQINRRLFDDAVSTVLVEAESLFAWDDVSQDRLLEGAWGEAAFTCRALILHITNQYLAIRLLEEMNLWLWPETRIVIVGDYSWMASVLYHQSLRNTVHVLYLVFPTRGEPTLDTRMKMPTSVIDQISQQQQQSTAAWRQLIDVYRRCQFCNNGEVDIQMLYRWSPTSGLQWVDDVFIKESEDFMGHKFRIVALPEFPLLDFRRHSDTPGTTMTPLDSLDVRILKAIAASANFTYEVREPWDGQWGIEGENDNWTGIVGTLQHQKADFSLLLMPTPTRLKVVHFTNIYIQDALVLLSLKPTLLPQHLAVIRPFTGLMWVCLTISVVIWAISLWLLQKAWSGMSEGNNVSLATAVLFSWGVLMQNWTPDPATNITGRTLVGLWLLSCLIITTAYRSSLVAHLVVQDKNPEINTFQDLLARDGWRWGTWRSGDAYTIYFQTNPDPIVQKVFERMEFATKEEQYQQVLEGGYSYIAYRYQALTTVATSYTNEHGYTPFYFSRTTYPPYLGEAWGFRRGAPFRQRISKMMQHLVEGAFIGYWMDNVIDEHIRKQNKKKEEGALKEQQNKNIVEIEEDRRAFGLDHLQGPFYLLLLGYIISFLTLLEETLAFCCFTSQQHHVK